jgi:drug/metabolite transporter (DMT)-like permease
MLNWFYIALEAYFLLAIVNLTDKFLIDGVIKNSKTYTFLVCFMGGAIFVLAPWFLTWPGLVIFLFNFLSGIIFVAALYFLYESLRRGDASRVVMVIGGTIPIFSVIFSYFFLHEYLNVYQIIGTVFLLIGVFTIAFIPSRHSFWEKLLSSYRQEISGKENIIIFTLLSALFYSLYFVISKYAYSQQPFLSGFIWIRFGAFLTVTAFLLVKKTRRDIIKSLKPAPDFSHQKKNLWLFLFNQVLGAGSFLLQNYAIALGPVAIINALQGFQYGLMIVLGFIFGRFVKLFRSDSSLRVVAQKIAALVFISIGLYFIAAL